MTKQRLHRLIGALVGALAVTVFGTASANGQCTRSSLTCTTAPTVSPAGISYTVQWLLNPNAAACPGCGCFLYNDAQGNPVNGACGSDPNSGPTCNPPGPAVCTPNTDAVFNTVPPAILASILAGEQAYTNVPFRTPFVTTLPSFNILVYDIPATTTSDLSGQAHNACFRMDAPKFCGDVGSTALQLTSAHELFHNVQRSYVCDLPVNGLCQPGPMFGFAFCGDDDDCTSPDTCEGVERCETDSSIGSLWGKWVAEGTARYMQDKISAALDTSTANSYHTGAQRRVLSPQVSLLSTAQFGDPYDACLFWNYVGEQFQTQNLNTIQFGADFIRDVFDTLAADAANFQIDALISLETAIAASGDVFRRTTLDQTWLDFAICNYAKNMNLSLPGADAQRYTYVDEADYTVPGTTYGTVPAAFSAIGGDNACTSLGSFAARYDQANPNVGPCGVVGFHGQSYSPMGWGLVGQTGSPTNPTVTATPAKIGKDVVLSLVDRPDNHIVQLGGVSASLETSTLFAYRFEAGTLTPEIVYPTETNPDFCAGRPDTPPRFTIKVYVEGPAGLKPGAMDLGVFDCGGLLFPAPQGHATSIDGLRPQDFIVELKRGGGTIPMTVRNATHVGSLAPRGDGTFAGSFWALEVGADAPLNEVGCFDLWVRHCPASVSDIELDSVCFGDLPVNMVLVVDRSGSMAGDKIQAAKDAATAILEGLRNTDRVAAVGFSGGLGCNNNFDDNDSGLQFRGAPGHRQEVLDFVNGLASGGSTSIGDGLFRAQAFLQPFAPDVACRRIVLLSDGLENASRRWDQTPLETPPVCPGIVCVDLPGECEDASCCIEAGQTKVDVKGFGPVSDSDYLQEIATRTGGIFEGVEDTDGAASVVAGVPLPSEALSMLNRLADSYMRSLERFRGLDRLFFKTDQIAANVTTFLNIEVTEAGVADAVFFFNFNRSDRAQPIQVVLVNPATGLPVTGAIASNSHVVFRLPGASPGTWVAEMTVGSDADYIAGLLGRQVLDTFTHLRLAVSQPDPGRHCTHYPLSEEGQYRQGVPVTLLATLTDAQGPVGFLGAVVEATVIKPDGTRTCPPLYLRDDGTQNDGLPNDGTYGLIYRDTYQSGSGGYDNDDPLNPPPPGARNGAYQVHVHAAGNSNFEEPFERWASTGFSVRTYRCDTDGDGLPDSWERYYHTNEMLANAADNADDDGLTNLEEFQNGTDPFDPDTDDDGEMDSSERDHGRCPGIADSPLVAPVDVEVITDTGDESSAILRPCANLLRFPWRPAYAEMRIYRAVDAPAGFLLHHTVSATPLHPVPVNYYDDAVEGGRQYFYRFQAVGPDGGYTRFSATIGAIPEGCPPSPPGIIVWDGDVLSPERVTRALRFRVDAPVTASGSPGQSAVKVTMIDLQNPNPPNLPLYPPPNFSAFESGTCTAAGEMNGCARWVGKPGTFLESQDAGVGGGTYRAARLQCTPIYWDWITETASGPIAVVGAEIVPSSMYMAQSYSVSCKGGEATCTNVSTPVTMLTRRSGDVEMPFNPPDTSTQPNVIDIAQLVNKFKSLPGAPIKAIAQLQPNLPELNADINALDIVAVVDAVKERAYAFSGPCACPSTVTCGPGAGSVTCTSPTVCVMAFGTGALCVKTCTGGVNAGDLCINDAHCPGGTCPSGGFCRDRCGRCSP